MKDKILMIILLAIFFGLVSGAIGAVFAKVYILESSFNLPFIGQIEYLNNGYGGSNLVIRNPRNVTVEQNTRISQTIKSSREQIVGIFKKKIDRTPLANESAEAKSPDINQSYQLSSNLGQGFIITSDGWIVSSYIPEMLEQANNETTASATPAIASNYVIIDSDRNIREVDNIIKDPKLSLSYWHIRAESLPVKDFINYSNAEAGNIILLTGWNQPYLISNISEKKPTNNAGPIYSSDDFFGIINTFPEINETESKGNFALSLRGGLLGIVGSNGSILSTTNFQPLLKALFGSEKLQRPALGISYVPLHQMAEPVQEYEQEFGALIHSSSQDPAVIPGGAADKAGLQEGDIITSINNTSINRDNDLNAIIAGFSPGNVVDIRYKRDGERQSAAIVLDTYPIKAIK